MPAAATMRWPLAGAALALLMVAALCLRREGAGPEMAASGRAFKLSHALTMAGLIAVMSLLAAASRHGFGEAGVLVAAVCVAWVEVHAAAASVAQLMHAGGLSLEAARWGVLAVLASSAVAKLVLAGFSGGRAYAAVVGSGLLAMVSGAVLVLIFGA